MKLLPFLAAYLCATCTLANDNIQQQATLKGKWLVETNGKVMLDPQTSALKLWRGKLLSLSDRSAHESQQKQLHIIDPSNAIVADHSLEMTMSDEIKASCFYPYLADKPDFEALAIDPNNDNVFIILQKMRVTVFNLQHHVKNVFKIRGRQNIRHLSLG